MMNCHKRAYPRRRYLLHLMAALGAVTLCLSITTAALADKIDQFNNYTYTGKTLKFQRWLSMEVPLSASSMLGSHNTYNTTGWNGKRYATDPNHFLSPLDQLRMGLYHIEADLHPLVIPTNAVWLCHKLCGIGDKRFEALLKQVKTFLDDPRYQQHIVIIFLEMDEFIGNSQEYMKIAADRIKSNLGSSVYTPLDVASDVNGATNIAGPCVGIPSDLTPKMMLDQNKRVVIYRDGSTKCKSINPDLRDLVFKGLGDIDKTWEDRTNISASSDKGIFANFSKSDVTHLFENGMNLVNLDKINVGGNGLPTDLDDFDGAVWTWATREPNNAGNNEHCAAQGYGQGYRWYDMACSKSYQFACENSAGQWAVTKAKGSWSEGQAQCQQVLPKGSYNFSTPVNAQANRSLTWAKSNAADWVWLNATDQSKKGTWEIKHRYNNPPKTRTKAKREDFSVNIEGHGLDYGKWKGMTYCPPGTYASGYGIRIEDRQGSNNSDDDSAANSVTLVCKGKDTGKVIEPLQVSPHAGFWGTWNHAACPDGQYITGLQPRVESPQHKGDDTALNTIQVMCDRKSVLRAHTGHFGDWKPWQHCPVHTAVCGVDLNIENKQTGSEADNTALNKVKLACCSLPIVTNGRVRGYDRPGHDYLSSLQPNRESCQSACAKDAPCKAWSFQHPTVGIFGTCYLKDSIPTAVKNDCCSSGIKTDETFQPGYDRLGQDYSTKNPPNPEQCQAHCANEDRCKAWTFKHPDSTGTKGICYLKESVPAPVANDCCTSGVKGGDL